MDITEILERRAFTIAFQPIVRLADRRAMGYEALARFVDGSRPDERFAEAGRAGLRPALELAALRAAVADARSLPARLSLFLNVSPSVMLGDGDSVGAAVAGAGRPVVLEISEGEAVPDPAALRAAFARHAPGVALALDDVGAGYADAARVRSLAPAFVKLDRELSLGMAHDGPRRVEGMRILTAAAALRAAVIGEGLEQEFEVLRLAALGVAYGQGWALGRPAPAASWSQSV